MSCSESVFMMDEFILAHSRSHVLLVWPWLPGICYNRMSSNSKLGLRNASHLLNVLRAKYARDPEDNTLLHNKTFLEEESLELYEHPNKEDSRLLSPRNSKTKKDQPIEALSEIKPLPAPHASFCDRLITRNLQQTLALYQQDLQILTDNKLLLEEKMEVMAEKIRKLRELEGNNRVLAAENEKAREFLGELVREYHDSLHLLFKSQLHQQELYNSLRAKARLVLKELAEDYHYTGFVEHWNAHLLTLHRHQHQLHSRIHQDQAEARRKEEAEKTREEEKAREVRAVAVAVPPQRERREGERREGERREGEKREEEEFLAPDEPKPKKRLSESEKASLLGDLKSFAKNFKFPSG